MHVQKRWLRVRKLMHDCMHAPTRRRREKQTYLLWETRMLFSVRALCQANVWRSCTLPRNFAFLGQCWPRSESVRRCVRAVSRASHCRLARDSGQFTGNRDEGLPCVDGLAELLCIAVQSSLLPDPVMKRTRLFNTATRRCASTRSISCTTPLRSTAMRRNRDPISLWSRMYSFFETLCMMCQAIHNIYDIW